MRLRNFILGSSVLLLIATSALSLLAQATSMKPSVVTGEVTSLGDGKIVLMTKDGSLDVLLSDKTVYKRVPPENPDPKAAVASALSDIGVGDKLLVTGIFPARQAMRLHLLETQKAQRLEVDEATFGSDLGKPKT